MSKNGYLVISLDFELLWGIFDHVDYPEMGNYFKNTRSLIPELLKMFSDYKIHCTWATVGMLFNENWEEWGHNQPSILPSYTKKKLSPYLFGTTIKAPETNIFCFAPNLIKQIHETPFQEIGTHTYSHYYCLEEGQDEKSFKKDLEKSVELARNMGIDLKSLVFPRNQFNEKYLRICFQLGIENVRSNPTNWYWQQTQNNALKNKIFRTGDAYLGLYDKSYPLSNLDLNKSKPLQQKASRLLRPYSENKILNTLKLNRIKDEMTVAAKKDEIYHLWWHPHNFGNHPEANLDNLKIIVEHFQKLNKKFGFQSANMEEIGVLKKT